MRTAFPHQLPPNVLVQFPAGSWGFVGSVDARLAYVTEDGAEPTQEQLEDARSFGPQLARVKTRSWPTAAAALAAAAELGLTVDGSAAR